MKRVWGDYMYIFHASYMYVRLSAPLDAGCERKLGVKEDAEV